MIVPIYKHEQKMLKKEKLFPMRANRESYIGSSLLSHVRQVDMRGFSEEHESPLVSTSAKPKWAVLLKPFLAMDVTIF